MPEKASANNPDTSGGTSPSANGGSASALGALSFFFFFFFFSVDVEVVDDATDRLDVCPPRLDVCPEDGLGTFFRSLSSGLTGGDDINASLPPPQAPAASAGSEKV